MGKTNNSELKSDENCYSLLSPRFAPLRTVVQSAILGQSTPRLSRRGEGGREAGGRRTCSVTIGTWLWQWLHVASRYLQAFSTWSRRSLLNTFSLQSARTHESSSNWQSFFKCTWKTNAS